VDELMDMGRTMVNLVGNCLASCVMARWEGEFTPGVPAGLAERTDVELVAAEERAVGQPAPHPRLSTPAGER
jgi:proton glutamate symport protein